MKGMKLMKENKDFQLKARFTARQKEEIMQYCEKHNISVSDFIRMACEEIIKGKTK